MYTVDLIHIDNVIGAINSTKYNIDNISLLVHTSKYTKKVGKD